MRKRFWVKFKEFYGADTLRDSYSYATLAKARKRAREIVADKWADVHVMDSYGTRYSVFGGNS